MFVKRCRDHELIGNFLKRKYPTLCQCLGKPDTQYIYISIGAYADLIDKISKAVNPTTGSKAARLKVYFASYAGTTIFSKVPESYFGYTTLIFCPVDGTEVDIPDNFWIIHPVTGIVTSVTQPEADVMAKYFKDNRASALKTVAEVAGQPQTWQESTSVWFELPKVNGGSGGWLDEMWCQGVDGVLITLGAYKLKDTYPVNGVDISIEWQLTLLFLLAKSVRVNGKDCYYSYDLEDVPDFPHRSGLPSDWIGGGDTANPCPPAKGCQTTIG